MTKVLHWLLETRQIDSIPNWQDKIKAIKDDLEKDNTYKINMYPHTFYFDDEDNAHTRIYMVVQMLIKIFRC